MKEFSTKDIDIKQIGEGGNSQTYLLEKEVNGYSSAVIKVPKARDEHRVRFAIERHRMLQENGIKTMAFLEECMLDGKIALLTENLHKEDFTYLDANAHLLREEDKLIRKLNLGFMPIVEVKEPEEERWFADHRFVEITNLQVFAKSHIEFLEKVSVAHIYLSYDSYYFRVNRQEKTDIDYIIADWDDVIEYDEDGLSGLNKEQFKEALLQFVDRYVEEEVGEKYKKAITSW